MADLNRMDHTWLCSVVFTDIVDSASQSVELQMKWKARFNDYLTNAIRNVPESDRVILDTGDGAAICFLGAPEAAMFAALELQQSFLRDAREQPHGLRVRIGINLGPVKLVKDINGALNAIGNGMNDGQRIMNSAAANQIQVSQSFFDVVSCLSDDYKSLFKLKGIETDKHVKEHIVYYLFPPGWDKAPFSVDPTNQQTAPAPAAASRRPSPAPESVPKSNTSAGGRPIALLVAGVALAVLAAAGASHFYRPSVPATPSVTATLTGQGQISATSPAATPGVTANLTEQRQVNATSPAAIPSIESPAPPSAPAPLPDNSAFDPKSLDPKENAKLSIDAEKMPTGLDFTVEMNGHIYFQRSVEGYKARYENWYVPPGVQEFRVTARRADVQVPSNTVRTEFKAKKRKTLKVELRLKGQNEDRGMPQGMYPDTLIVLTLK